ncbi:MAG: PAS domain S-box protein [Vicinamibacteria bacterium]
MRGVRVGGSIAAASGLLALLGWTTGRPFLASLGAHNIPMAPSTALLFVLYGIAALLAAPEPIRPGRRMAALALSMAGALTAGPLLVLSSLGIHPAFERLGLQAVGSVGAAPIGHMSPVTAACFLLASASLVGALAPAARGDWQSAWASSSAWVLLAASSVLVLAYLFGSPLFYGGSLIPPAATTSAAFAALAAALIGLSRRRAEARGRARLFATLPRALVLLFGLLAAAIFGAGGFYYRSDAARYRAYLEQRLRAVADLKAGELAQWRAERVGDASLFLANPPFAALVRRLFARARDGEAETQVRTWLTRAQAHYPYDRVSLLDPRGSEKLAVPGEPRAVPAAVASRAADALRSASVVFVDFYRDERDGRVRLSVLVPILDERAGPLAVLALGIDPETNLYPLVAHWPTPSPSGATALVRREGNDAVLLSELRPGDGSALTSRTPLSSRNAAVVKAVLGQEGIVEAEDRGTSVIAALRAIPGSGWFLVAQMDAAEANAPLRDRLRSMLVLLGGLLAAMVAGVAAVWREQRVRDLRQQRETERRTEEHIRRLNRVYAVLSEVNQAIVRVRDPAALFAEACRIAVETGGFRMAWVGRLEPEGGIRPVAHAGVVDGYLERLQAAEHGELEGTLELLRQGRHDVWNDIEADPRMAPWRADALALGYRASVAFPLSVNGEAVAAFTLYAGEPGFFDESELRLLDEMAMDLSFAMDTARLEDLSLRLATAVDQAPVSVVVTGIDGRIEYVNPAFTRITGYAPAEAVGQNPRMLKSGKQDAALYRELWATISAGGSWHGQLVNRRKDGSLYAQELTIAPIRDRAGHVLRFVGIGQDVTERRKAEHALQLARSALDQAADMILWVDRDGRLIYANETAASRLGYARDELLGSEIWRIAVGPSPEAWPGMWEAARQAGSLRTEGASRRKDGSSFPSEVVVTHVAFGETELQCAVVRDIAERRRAEAAILEEKEFSEALLDSLPGIFGLFDQAGRLLRWNRAFEAASGYSAQELAAMGPADFFGGADRAKVEDGFRDVFETGSASAELALRAKDGRQIPHYFVGVRVAMRGAACCIVTAIDVTASKALEDQLRQSQKIEAIGQLAGGVAHDFNNILGVITGYGELAQRQLAAGHPARARVDEIVKAAARAADLTHQLLAFSRRQIMQPRALDLNGLIAGSQAMLGRLLGEHLELVVRLGSELGTVMADPGQIEQVVLNLALNARDAMPKGGSLTLETSNVELDEAYAAAHAPAVRGRYVMLAVSDTGIGMDPETQQRIFEPFFTTKPEGQGTGLGLATVYGIVKQSGGFIWVYSEPGRGTTFKVYLPRLDQPAQHAAAAGPTGEAPRGVETILLVEDTETLREVIREILEERGYTLLLALDGEEALALARAHDGPIDLLLTDVVMPKLGGRDLALRLSETRPAMRVLYMSGYTDGAISQHGILGEGLALLEKPFSADRLARAVREALDRD